LRKVIHLIPYDGIGGVERAANTMGKVACDDINFSVRLIFPSEAATSRLVIWNPWYYLKVVAVLWHNKPDVLIVSLWRACVVGVLLNLLRPRVRLVLFLHSSNDAHWLDRAVTRLAVHYSCSVWADSRETLMRRLPNIKVREGIVISFITSRIVVLQSKQVRPVFIFFGRIHLQKGLERALKIFAAVFDEQPLASFLVIGPDCGDLARVTELVDKLGLGAAVNFLGPMNFSDIRKVAAEASFFLQTSELEGMAMSVVEAMQLGLVPVVTPVGEIGRYAQHGKNAIVVSKDQIAVADILALLDDDARYQEVRAQAIATWVDYPLYRDSVLDACRKVLRTETSESKA
jgi:glycosyltransferase involved in cell wall biosynthesis